MSINWGTLTPFQIDLGTVQNTIFVPSVLRHDLTRFIIFDRNNYFEKLCVVNNRQKMPEKIEI